MKTGTIKDIARSLNLSTSTSSRALRDSSEIGVETKRRVMELAQRIDGIFASSDNIAIGCHAAITEAGLTMPNNIALVGFSDLLMAALLNSPLSSVAQSAFETGRSAAELLINLIRNPREHSTSISNVLKKHLIVRKSSLRVSNVVESSQ